MTLPRQAPEQDTVAVLVFPGCSEFEVTVALTLLARTRRVVTVAPSRAPVRGEGGLTLLPDVELAELDPAETAALLIPGAPDLSALGDDAALNRLIRSLHARRRLLAAICGGPLVLARLGLLEGRTYTVTFTREQRQALGVFPEAGYRYQDVVYDGHIITAQGHAFAAFGLGVAGALGGLQNRSGARQFFLGQGHPVLAAEAAQADPGEVPSPTLRPSGRPAAQADSTESRVPESL